MGHLGPPEFNFFHKGVTPEDVESIFGPFETSDGPFHEVDMESCLMAHLMHMAGCFASVSQARKNGWNKSVPCGYNEFMVGKSRTRLNVWFPCKGPGCNRPKCGRK